MARSSSGGTRRLAVRVKSGRRRKPSSKEWLERQLNDPFVAEARRVGYRSRTAFKLIQLDTRFHLLAPGRRVVDLDLLATDPMPGASLLTGDFRDPATTAQIRDALGGPADLVLSDMAAPA